MRAALGGTANDAAGALVVICDPRLAEEAVLRAFAASAAGAERPFRRERDRVYELPDREQRDAAFDALHLRWFNALALDGPVRQAIAEQPGVASRVGRALLLPALARREQMADLVFVECGGAPACDGHRVSGEPPTLALHLTPESFVDRDALVALLRHELLHVADMLDPVFAYERALPPAAGGPSLDRVLRDRYRTVWDATIDGRLAACGRAGPGVADARRSEFARIFPHRVGDFERWFKECRPTHAAIVAFIAGPPDPGPGSDRL